MEPLGHRDPRAVGKYELTGRLGEGGMGVVYQGRSPGGRVVAVKLAREDLAVDPGFRERFRSEVAAARRVGGFHTAQVVDADPDADPPWMVTAFIAGRPLDRMVLEQGPLRLPALRALGAALAEALTAIHSSGLVHRDLKPSNIIMSEDGPRVIDFGIARAMNETRLTRTQQAVGTPGYLAPEQISGSAVGPEADVFALGAVLVHASGGSAFGSGDPMALMYRAVHDEPDVRAVPAEMRSLVHACLAKDPGRRPAPADLLEAWADRTPRPAPGRTEPPVDAEAATRVRSGAEGGAAGPPDGTRETTTRYDTEGASVTFTHSGYARLEKAFGALWPAPPAFIILYNANTAAHVGELLFFGAYGAVGILIWTLIRVVGAAADKSAITVSAAGLTVTGSSTESVTVPWSDIVSVGRPDGASADSHKVLVRLRPEAVPPPSRREVRSVAPDRFILTIPSGDPEPAGARRARLRQAVEAFAPQVNVRYL